MLIKQASDFKTGMPTQMFFCYLFAEKHYFRELIPGRLHQLKMWLTGRSCRVAFSFFEKGQQFFEQKCVKVLKFAEGQVPPVGGEVLKSVRIWTGL